MPDPVNSVLTKLKTGRDYILNSSYDILWTGYNASRLNAPFNGYIEAVNIPGRTISTSEVRLGNTIAAKHANELSFEDLEITWRVSEDFGIYNAIAYWMDAVKEVLPDGSMRTGYFDDYCLDNRCEISIIPSGSGQGGKQKQPVVVIEGLYPTAIQSIAFSSEGGEYIKLTATFSCYRITKP